MTDNIVVPAVLLEGNALIVLAILVIIAALIAGACGRVDPPYRKIDVVMPARVVVPRITAVASLVAFRLVEARSLLPLRTFVSS